MDTRRFWNERLTAHWGIGGVGYLSLGEGFNRWMYKIRRAVFRDILSGRRGGKDACDIGAGTGFYTFELQRAGYRVVGVDISSYAVERLRATCSEARFVEGDVSEKLDGRYDLIIAMDILFHIVDDTKYREALRHIHGALKNGGTFMFSDNFPKNRIAAAHHVSRSESEILTALSAAGFAIKERRPMFILMNAPVKKGATLWWHTLERILWRMPFLGSVCGAALYPWERLLVSIRKKTYSTEIVVCEKA